MDHLLLLCVVLGWAFFVLLFVSGQTFIRLEETPSSLNVLKGLYRGQNCPSVLLHNR